MDSFRCPKCRGRSVGRVGVAQWYCWDCCVEFQASGDGYAIFAMDEEGELVPVAEQRDANTEVQAG